MVWTGWVSPGFGQKSKILFLAGQPSHGWNQHEYVAGSQVLADCLNQSGLPVSAEMSEGWPSFSEKLSNLAAIVIYTDGEALHVAKGQTDTLRKLHQSGTGIVVLHYALEGADAEMNRFYIESIGGFFEVGWSVNPHWTLENAHLSDHPTSSGVQTFLTEDEWYFHMRFRENMNGVTPVLSTHPTDAVLGRDGPRSGNPDLREALKAGEAQHLAWAAENPGAGRGVALTGGNFHHNWSNDDFRKLVLNGIVWAAGLDLPDHGVPSRVSGLIRYKTIGEAIARNDLEDVNRHLEKNPQDIDKPGRGNMTALHQAILRKRPEAAAILLEAGGDPNVLTSRNQSALHLAIERDLTETARLILKSGINLGVRDSQGWTALHLAAAKNRNQIVKLLLQHGVVVSHLSAAGGTPLHEAAVSGDAELIHLLIDAGIDPKSFRKREKALWI